MILYHGSTTVVEKPHILQSERMLDFGAGFYTTTNKEQAARWALKVSVRRKSDEQYISVYDFDYEKARNDLKIIKFDKPDENWLDFINICRRGKNITEGYDLVFGPVADDNVYTVVALFEIGVYDKDETLKRLRVEQLYNQVLFHTEKALQYCIYREYIPMKGKYNG